MCVFHLFRKKIICEKQRGGLLKPSHPQLGSRGLRNYVIICQVVLVNLSKVSLTTLNKVPVKDARVVAHNDVLTVADRSFRVDFLHGSPANVLQIVSNV